MRNSFGSLTHNQFLRVGSQLLVVVHGVFGVEDGVVGLLIVEERSDVAGLFVPVAVVVVGHDVDDVEVAGERGDVVARIDDL